MTPGQDAGHAARAAAEAQARHAYFIDCHHGLGFDVECEACQDELDVDEWTEP